MKPEEFNDETVLNNGPENYNNGQFADNAPVDANKAKSESKTNWGSFASGAVSGVILGSAATFLATTALKGEDASAATVESSVNSESATTEGENTTNATDAATTDAAADTANAMQGADTVNDSMSFSEAFSAAREEVGPGGYFEWKGNIYSTFSKEEWDSMSEDEQFSYTQQAMEGYAAENSVNATEVADNQDVNIEDTPISVNFGGNEDGNIVINVDLGNDANGAIHNAVYNGPQTTGATFTPTADTVATGMPEAHSVNDGMTFAQAFASARAEVGAGGYFEWKGGVYQTFYENEWNNMSPSEQASYTRQAIMQANDGNEIGAQAQAAPANFAPVGVPDMPSANSVNDGMTFAQAFEAARDEVGSGGYFEWRGNVYTTFNENEWNSMTPQQQAGFTNQAMNNAGVIRPQQQPNYQANNNNNNTNVEIGNINDEVVEEVPDNDVNVEVLGIETDPTDGSITGHLAMNGEEAYLIDVDGNQVFDTAYAAGNEDVEYDMQDQGITVDQLEQMQQEQQQTPDSTPDSTPAPAAPEATDDTYLASYGTDYINDADDVYEA